MAVNKADLPYQPGLDGLRAFAVTAVVLSHYLGAHFGRGFIGVDVFFVVSGYLITVMLSSELATTGAINVRRFWLRRLFRLMPALWAMASVTAVASALGWINESGWATLATLAYVRNWFCAVNRLIGEPTGHTWSLGVEEQFYLVWPLMLLWAMPRFGKQRMAWWACAVAGAGLIGEAVFGSSLSQSGLSFGVRPWFALLAGVALGLLPWARARALSKAGWVAALGLCWMTLEGVPGGDGVLFAAAAVASVVAVVAVVDERSSVRRVLSFPVFVTVGRMSYSIYLWHYPAQAIAQQWILPEGSRALSVSGVAAAITAIAAPLSYAKLETPCRNWGRRWADRRFVSTVSVASAGT